MSPKVHSTKQNVVPHVPKRRWYQFSRRRLLVFALLVSIAMNCWLAVSLHRVRQQMRAVRDRYWRLVDGHFYSSMFRYNTHTTSAGDVNLIVRGEAPLTEKDVPYLREIVDNEWAGASFLLWSTHVGCRSVIFQIWGPDPGLQHVKELGCAKPLRLLLDRPTDAGLEHLAGLANLHELCLFGPMEVTDAGLEHLQGLVDLEFLGLLDLDATGAGLKHLKDSTRLKELYIGNAQHSDRTLGFTDAGLEHVKGLSSLEVLDLSGTQVTDAGLEHLKGLTALRVLVLCETQVTDAGLEHLRGLKNLEALGLHGSQVSAAGLRHLKALTGLQFLSLPAGAAHKDPPASQVLPGVEIEPMLDARGGEGFWDAYIGWKVWKEEVVARGGSTEDIDPITAGFLFVGGQIDAVLQGKAPGPVRFYSPKYY